MMSTDSYWQLADARARYRARFLAALDAGRFDAIISPPDALPAYVHGASLDLQLDPLLYSTLYNVLGMPAGVVAATRVRAGEESDRRPSRDNVERTARRVEAGSAGLPVGVQVAARHWREDITLAVMAALEEHFRGRPDYPTQPPSPSAPGIQAARGADKKR
jgi:fatty acid amide hydrolase